MKFDSIKSRLLLMTLICVLGMGLLVTSQHLVNQKLLQLSQQREALLRLNNELLQLRRHEKDFLLRGQIRYLDQFSQRMTSFNRQLVELESVFSEYALNSNEPIELAQTMARYNDLFFEVVAIHKKIGLGAEQGMRASFDAQVNTLAEMNAQPQVLVLVEKIKLAQRDMLLSFDGRYKTVFEQSIAALPQSLIGATETQTLVTMFYDLTTLIQQIGETESEGLRGEFRRQAHLMESQLTNIDESLQPVISKQADRVRTYSLLIAVSTSIVLLLVLIKSFATFHRAFSYFVMFFYQCKRQYQRIDPKRLGFAEFKSLAELANEMVEARQEAERKLADAQQKLDNHGNN